MKGTSAELVAFMVMTALITGALAGVGITWVDGINDNIRLDSISIAEGRMESVIYAVDALDEGKVQINYQDEYNLTMVDGEKHISYELDEDFQVNSQTSDSRELNPPVDLSISEGKNHSFCISKSGSGSSVSVNPGVCS